MPYKVSQVLHVYIYSFLKDVYASPIAIIILHQQYSPNKNLKTVLVFRQELAHELQKETRHIWTYEDPAIGTLPSTPL